MNMNRPRSQLVIYGGTEICPLSYFEGETFVYTIGGGIPGSSGSISVNDPIRLHEIAIEERDAYSRWIYSFNQTFLNRRLVFEEMSLFLLSDCSCKRTEIFETYAAICNLLLICEIIKEKTPDRIVAVSCDGKFLRSLHSVAGQVPVIVVSKRGIDLKRVKRFLSDLRFVSEITAITFLKALALVQAPKRLREVKRQYFTIYPKMCDSHGKDNKYGSLVGADDEYAATIISDGYHQHVSILEYFRLRRKAFNAGIVVIDEYLSLRDCIKCVYWLSRLRISLIGASAATSFRNIDTSLWIKEEFSQSASRLGRFMGIMGSFERFFDDSETSEFVYYLHEYSIGRMMSWLLGRHSRTIKAIGFQHGPAAWRKLVYFTCPEEVSGKNNYRTTIPMPKEVLAEDNRSMDIYRYAGYQNVSVMKSIYRLAYLEDIKIENDKLYSLIVPGLNDGAIMLNVLVGLIKKDYMRKYFLKPHPLANNYYINELELIQNLVVTTDPIDTLLSTVSEVFVTYSSVGVEARRIGITVKIVDIPGRINQSPLLDEVNATRDTYRENGSKTIESKYLWSIG